MRAGRQSACNRILACSLLGQIRVALAQQHPHQLGDIAAFLAGYLRNCVTKGAAAPYIHPDFVWLDYWLCFGLALHAFQLNLLARKNPQNKLARYCSEYHSPEQSLDRLQNATQNQTSPAPSGREAFAASGQRRLASGPPHKSRMKISNARNSAGLLAAFNLDNLKRTADYYRANSQRFPLWRIALSKKLCRRMSLTAKRIADKFNLTPVQARSVLMDLGCQRLFGVKAPGRSTQD